MARAPPPLRPCARARESARVREKSEPGSRHFLAFPWPFPDLGRPFRLFVAPLMGRRGQEGVFPGSTCAAPAPAKGLRYFLCRNMPARGSEMAALTGRSAAHFMVQFRQDPSPEAFARTFSSEAEPIFFSSALVPWPQRPRPPSLQLPSLRPTCSQARPRLQRSFVIARRRPFERSQPDDLARLA
jgi:hypothetical protein